MTSVTFSSFVKQSQAFRQSTLPLLLGIMSQAHAQSLDSFSSCWSQNLMISNQSSAYLTSIVWVLNTLTLIDQPATPIGSSLLAQFPDHFLALSFLSLLSQLLCFSSHSTHFTGSFLRLLSLCISPLPQLSFGSFCLSSACHIGFYPPPHIPTFISKLFPSVTKY